MKITSTTHQTRFLGPRALALISCALALLAAQPVMASKNHNTIVAVRVAGIEANISGSPTMLREEQSSSIQRQDSRTFFASARRLHIIATVEILQRLLAYELRPLERQVFVAFAPNAQQVCAFDLPVAPRHRVTKVSPPQSPAERQFVQARCLLAPPPVTISPRECHSDRAL